MNRYIDKKINNSINNWIEKIYYRIRKNYEYEYLKNKHII